MKNALIISGIPVSVALSWIIGGELVHKVSPLVLSSSRLFVGALILLTIFLSTSKRGTREAKSLTWWRDQVILCLTGRVIYYYLSSLALLTISPLDALLITSLMPFFTLVIEFALGNRFKSKLLPIAGSGASAFAFAAIASTKNFEIRNAYALGHWYIVGALFFFVLHLALYGRMTKDRSPVEPLLAQFAIGFVFLIPFDFSGYGAFLTFSTTEWLQFLIYAAVCNLMPFILVHFALKTFSSLTVASASVASPVLGIVFSHILDGTTTPVPFLALGMISLLLTWVTIRLNLTEKKNEQQH